MNELREKEIEETVVVGRACEASSTLTQFFLSACEIRIRTSIF
jgi:hypothetical protein